MSSAMRAAAGENASVRATGAVGKVTNENGHASKEEVEDTLPNHRLATIVVNNLVGDLIAEVTPTNSTVDALKDAIAPHLDTPNHLTCLMDLVQGECCLVEGGEFDVNGLPITVLQRTEPRALVVAVGSDTCKAGFAGDDAPRVVLPSCIGHADEQGKTYVCEEAMGLAKQGMLQIEFPIEKGLVTNWAGMEAIWHHTFFNELRVNPEEHKILLVEAAIGPRVNRERMTSIMFETFKVPAMYLNLAAVLALYSSGRTTGLVVDSGHSVTHVVPIYEGYALPHAIRRLDVGGRDLTEFMGRLLAERGHIVTATADCEHLRNYKERCCYVALDVHAEMNCVGEQSQEQGVFELADGRTFSPGSERFRCPEALFQPRLAGKEIDGIHEAVHSAIMHVDFDIHKDLYHSILLAGGSMTFKGMEERLAKELRALVPLGCGIKVIAPPEQKYAVWKGGSILASLSTFQGMWVMKADYDESGPQIVHRKCF
eukprot:TRINITY_DN73641_c0_g1_i1.p1 TRINITY_DN73641_c0_g1~~TRINITY_DN73641_c0_g1_i1.p1  ORF type:complete len:484 (-),score=87.80 TRINITY_DN73641_c0_g1_i1:789-2240(-)